MYYILPYDCIFSYLIEYQYEIKWDLVFISLNEEIDPDNFFLVSLSSQTL